MPLPNVNEPKSIRDQLSDPKKSQHIKEIEFAEKNLVVDESITLTHSLGESTKICLAQDKKDGNFYWLKTQPVEKSYVVHTDHAASIGIAPSAEIDDPEKKEKQIGFLYPYGQQLDQYLENFKTKKQQGEVTNDDESKLVIKIYLKLRELAYRGILHKGINSENIMIDLKGDIHFINFEQAKKSIKIEDQHHNIKSIAQIFGFGEISGLSSHIDLVIIGLISSRSNINFNSDQANALEKSQEARDFIINMYQLNSDNINQSLLEALFLKLPNCENKVDIYGDNISQKSNIDELIDNASRIKKKMFGDDKAVDFIDKVIVDLIINGKLGANLNLAQKNVLNNSKEIRAMIIGAYHLDTNAVNQKFLESVFSQIPICTTKVTLKDAQQQKENDYDKLLVVHELVKGGLMKLAYNHSDVEVNGIKANLYKQLFKDVDSKYFNRNELLLLLSQLDEIELLDHRFDQAGPKIESLHNLEIQTAKNLLNFDVEKNKLKVKDLQVSFVANALKVGLIQAQNHGNIIDDTVNEFISRTLKELDSPSLTLEEVSGYYKQSLRMLTYDPARWSRSYGYPEYTQSYVVSDPYLKIVQNKFAISEADRKSIIYDGETTVSQFGVKKHAQLKLEYENEKVKIQELPEPKETNKPFQKQGEIVAELAKKQQQRTPLSPDQ
ncbi:hypothetical protein L3V83_02805 [Thiotrichales bacterium 19X7-9]|nr:hypothetical protein [Thiotrichales bacterium 19X7-9]